MFTRRKMLPALGAAVMVAVLGATGCSAGNDHADGLDPVTLRLDYFFNGYNVPFAAGVEEGFYEEAGLDVTIEEGRSSATTIKTVQSGTDEFGVAGANAILAAVVNEDVPVKSLGTYVQQNPIVVTWHEEAPVHAAEDLRGRDIFIQPGFSGNSLFSLVLKEAGIDEAEVTYVSVDPAAGSAKFLATPDAVAMAFVNGDYIREKMQLPTLGATPIGEFGVNVLATSLITSTDLMQRDPDLVDRFMQATTKAWEWALEHPDEAVDAAMKVFPEAEEEVVRQGFIASMDLLRLESAEGHLPGWTAPEEWESSAATLFEVGELDRLPEDSSVYFTNEYLDGQD